MSFYLGQPEYAPSVAAEAERLKAQVWQQEAAAAKDPVVAARAAEQAALHQAAALGYTRRPATDNTLMVVGVGAAVLIGAIVARRMGWI